MYLFILTKKIKINKNLKKNKNKNIVIQNQTKDVPSEFKFVFDR